MPTLEDAILLAVQAHHKQVDRNGQPYILHPLRVMFRLTSETERIVGVLHDVVEDTDFKFHDLRQMGYGDQILEALDCLTKRDGEAYEHLIERARGNATARRVKLADLEDNMDVRRLSTDPSDDDLKRMRKYRKAWAALMDELTRE